MDKIDVNAIKNAVITISQDETKRTAFAADPVKTIESILGVDLPDVDSIKKTLG